MDTKPASTSKQLKNVLIIAGEASGDLHAAHLVEAMKRLNPDMAFSGIGGEKMEKAGVTILVPASEMAVVGLTEVFSKLRIILNAAKLIKAIIKNDKPDLLILIDFPDFNLHIAKTAKRFFTPVLYYISPQVWAWRRGRIRKIAKRVDRMAVILPFEKDCYSKTDLKVDYVGHPLLDEWNPQAQYDSALIKTSEAREKMVIGLLPGSRKEEIRNMLPVMVGAVNILKERFPHLKCVLPLAPGIEKVFVQAFMDHCHGEIEPVKGNIYEVLSGCQLALVTSGTATLETAVAGIPMVIIYKVSHLSYWIGRMFIKVPFIGLVNLVADESVAPELIQQDVTAERLAQEAFKFLDNPEVMENAIHQLRSVREKLGQGGASERTAEIALQIMK